MPKKAQIQIWLLYIRNWDSKDEKPIQDRKNKKH